MDHLCYICVVFVMLSRLFIAAMWSPDIGPCIHRIRLDRRIGPEIGHFALFLKLFCIIIMFVKYVYDHNNDVWIIR